MRLYLDLNKSGGQTSGGKVTPSEEQSIAEHDESFLESPSGVANASNSYDDPDKGKKWNHGNSLDDAQEEKRQKRNDKAAKRNLIPTEEEAGMKKAFDESANDMVKSLTNGLRDSLGLHQFTSTEVEFLQIIKGYSPDQIQRGEVSIAGRDRKLFSDWLCQRVAKSLDDLYRR